jgi:hypothetical protein
MTHVHKDSNAPAVEYETRGAASGPGNKTLIWVWNYNICEDCQSIFNRTFVRAEVQ